MFKTKIMVTTNKFIKETLQKSKVEIYSDMAIINHDEEGVYLSASYNYDKSFKGVVITIENFVLFLTEYQNNMIFDHMKDAVSKEF